MTKYIFCLFVLLFYKVLSQCSNTDTFYDSISTNYILKETVCNMCFGYKLNSNCKGKCQNDDTTITCMSHGSSPCFASYLVQQYEVNNVYQNCTITDPIISNMMSDRDFTLQQTKMLYPLGENVSICVSGNTDNNCYLYVEKSAGTIIRYGLTTTIVCIILNFVMNVH